MGSPVSNCNADHRYFVADVAVNEPSGTVTVIALCTACGDFISRTFNVAAGTKLLKKEPA